MISTPYWFQLGDITWALYSLKLAIQLALRLLGGIPKAAPHGHRRSRASTVPLHRCPVGQLRFVQFHRPWISAATSACFTTRKMSINMVPFGTKPGFCLVFFCPGSHYCEDREDLDEAFNNPQGCHKLLGFHLKSPGAKAVASNGNALPRPI